MEGLKSYSGYAKVAPYTPFDRPCSLVSLDGNAAAAGWLQIHDKASAPSAAAVPLKSFQVSAAGPLPSIFQTLGPIALANGLTLAMSSTETTYTAVATAFDVFGEIEQYEIPNSTKTALTAMVNDDLITWWSDSVANTTKRLFDVSITNGEGAARYAMLFAAGPTDGDIPLVVIPLPDATPVKRSFGTSGLRLFSTTGGGQTPHYGCFLAISTTATVLTSASSAGVSATGNYITL